MNNFKYSITDALRSLGRNKTMTVASIITVLITLLVFGVFMLTALNVSMGLSTVQSKVEVKVYLSNGISSSQQESIVNTIKKVNGVSNVTYVSSDQALSNFKKETATDEQVLQSYNDSNNPLPASYTVSFNNPNVADNVVKAVTDSSTSTGYMEGVASIGNDQTLINTIDSINKTVRYVGLIMFVVLMGVSLFLIMNTIKITVFSRRTEIGIMKFVGATDWFIRLPFVIEGLVIGLIGSIVAVGILYVAYSEIYKMLVSSIFLMNFLSPSYILTNMSWEFIVGGAAIGVVGSIISLSKFLRV